MSRCTTFKLKCNSESYLWPVRSPCVIGRVCEMVFFLTSYNVRILTGRTQTQIQRPSVVNRLTGHCESTNEQPDVSSSDHDTFAPVYAIPDSRVLVLPRSPDPHEQDEEIKDYDSHETFGVDGHLLFVRFLPPRSGVSARGGLGFHGESSEEEKKHPWTRGLFVTLMGQKWLLCVLPGKWLNLYGYPVKYKTTQSKLFIWRYQTLKRYSYFVVLSL